MNRDLLAAVALIDNEQPLLAQRGSGLATDRFELRAVAFVTRGAAVAVIVSRAGRYRQ